MLAAGNTTESISGALAPKNDERKQVAAAAPVDEKISNAAMRGVERPRTRPHATRSTAMGKPTRSPSTKTPG